jgi:hypothetical protein
MDPMTDLSRSTDDASVDPNVLAQGQSKAASVATGEMAAIPQPPPLPGAGTLSGGATAAPSSPSDATPSIPPLGTLSPPSASQIFANDPSRPGAGYVNFNGQPTRIEGTTAAGKDLSGQIGFDAQGNRTVTSQDRYILDGGVLGDFINPDDYYNFLGSAGGGAAPTPTAGGAGGAGGSVIQPPTNQPSPTEPGSPLSPGAPNPVPVGTTPTVSARMPVPPGPATDGGTGSIPTGTAQMPQVGSAIPAANGSPSAPFTDANVQIDSTVLPNASPRLAGVQGMVDNAYNNVANVDRVKLGEDIFDQFSKSTDPAYKLALRRAGISAAGAGRIGSGQLRTSIGDLASTRAQQLDLAKRGFMSDALSGSIEDSFRKAGLLSGLEGQLYGQDAATRGELRGERGYQGSLEQQAFERALGQYQQEQNDVKDRFARGATEQQIGATGNPADYYAEMARQLNVDPTTLMLLTNAMGKGSVGSPTTPGLPQIPQIGTPPIVAPQPMNDPILPPGTAVG